MSGYIRKARLREVEWTSVHLENEAGELLRQCADQVHLHLSHQYAVAYGILRRRRIAAGRDAFETVAAAVGETYTQQQSWREHYVTLLYFWGDVMKQCPRDTQDLAICAKIEALMFLYCLSSELKVDCHIYITTMTQAECFKPPISTPEEVPLIWHHDNATHSLRHGCFILQEAAEQPQSDQSPLPGTTSPVPSCVTSEKEANVVVQVWPGVTADAHQYGLSDKRSALQPTQSRDAKRCCESTQEIVSLSRGRAAFPIVFAGDCIEWTAKWHKFDRAHSCTLHTCSVFESPFHYDPPFSASQSRWHNRFGAPEAGSMGAIGRESLAGRDDELVCGNPKEFCMHMAPQHPLHMDSLGVAQYNRLASVPGEARHDECESMSEAASGDGDPTATGRPHKYFLAPAPEGNTKSATCLVMQAAQTLDIHAVAPSCDWHPECDALIEESYEGELQLMHRDQEASPTPASGQQKRQEEGQDGHMQQAEAGGEICYISIGIPKPDLDQVGSVSADWPGPDTAYTQSTGITDEVSHTKDSGCVHKLPGEAMVKQECWGPAAVGSPSTRDMTDNPNSVDGYNMEDKAMVHRGCLNKTLIGTTWADDCTSSSAVHKLLQNVKPDQDWCSRVPVAAPRGVSLSRTMGHYGKHKLSGKSGVVSDISAVPDGCSQGALPAMWPQHAEDAPKCMLANTRFEPGRCAALSELRASIYTGVRVDNRKHGHASGIKLVFLEPQSAHSGDSNGNAADQEAAQRSCTDFHGNCIRCWCS